MNEESCTRFCGQSALELKHEPPAWAYRTWSTATARRSISAIKADVPKTRTWSCHILDQADARVGWLFTARVSRV
jgi:hypothetical protein